MNKPNIYSILIPLGVVLILVLGISQAIALNKANGKAHSDSVNVVGKSINLKSNFVKFSITSMVIVLLALFFFSWVAGLVVDISRGY